MRTKPKASTRPTPAIDRIAKAVKENPGKQISALIPMVYFSASRGSTRYAAFRRAIRYGKVRTVTKGRATYLYPPLRLP